MISMAMVLVIILPINNQYSYKTDLSLSIVQMDESPIKLQFLILNPKYCIVDMILIYWWGTLEVGTFLSVSWCRNYFLTRARSTH